MSRSSFVSIWLLAALWAASSAVAESELAEELAKTGDASGVYRLGRVFEVGREVERDLFEAARQYQRAAEQGHVEAQFALGLLLVGALEDGLRDERKAFEWFRAAAEAGHAKAAYFLAIAYESGVGTPANPERAFEWYRRAAVEGLAGAMNAIAHMYASGETMKANLPNAHAWNQVAIARGFEGATHYEGELEARMSEAEIARAHELAKGLLRKYGGEPAEQQP